MAEKYRIIKRLVPSREFVAARKKEDLKVTYIVQKFGLVDVNLHDYYDYLNGFNSIENAEKGLKEFLEVVKIQEQPIEVIKEIEI